MVAIRNNVLGCAEQMYANAMRLSAHLCFKCYMMCSDVDLGKNDCILKKNAWNSAPGFTCYRMAVGGVRGGETSGALHVSFMMVPAAPRRIDTRGSDRL